MNEKIGGSVRAAVAAALALACTAAQAAPEALGLELRASGGYSDNVNRASGADATSSATFALGGRFDWRETTRRLDGNVNADLDYVFYEEDDTDDELVGNLEARLRFGIVPERFMWVVDNSYGQGRFDLTQPSGPRNSEGINFFSTGPDLLVQLSKRDFLQFFARYANSWYEESEGNNDQYGGGATIGRHLDQRSSVSFTANYNRIEYSADGAPEVDTMQYFANYTVEGARTTFDLDLGYRTIDDGIVDEGAPLVRADLRRSLSDYATVFAFANYEYNDRAGSLSGDLSRPDFPTEGDWFSAGGIFEETAGGMGASYDRSRTRLRGSMSYRDQDYVESDTNDSERLQLDLNLERQLGPRWSAGVRGQYWTEEYTDGDSDESMAALYARWNSARTFGVGAEWQYWDRSSDFGDSHENAAWLRVTWQPIKRGTLQN